MNKPKFRFYNRLPEKYKKNILNNFTEIGGQLDKIFLSFWSLMRYL